MKQPSKCFKDGCPKRGAYVIRSKKMFFRNLQREKRQSTQALENEKIISSQVHNQKSFSQKKFDGFLLNRLPSYRNAGRNVPIMKNPRYRII